MRCDPSIELGPWKTGVSPCCYGYLAVKRADVQSRVAEFIDGVDFSSVEQQVIQLTYSAITTYLHNNRVR